MAWSTSQLADLAGTTLRTIRHYHDVGLLAEPERRANGYKSYGVPHLVRVLRIKRLTDLGLSLTQIAELGDGDEHPGEALRALDAELGTTIERLQRIRAELALVLSQETPTDLPPDVAAMIENADLSPQDRAFTVVLAQLLSPETLAKYAGTLDGYSRHPAVVAFDTLPEDADEETRQRVADAMREMPYMAQIRAAFPDPAGLWSDAPRGVEHARRTVVKVLVELYNKAQLDVLVRMGA
ncbi:MerR family transcriptional regulator [Lentzea sp. NEAU-D7]|uniref:MerR family transcriptional regulator n=1 Tax=Lentzea sp. NEAU-D7 TaxID=2994667 RepID=UPI00224A6E01|nr:MerR family transcriptional regulator [Lentzea sp. NEAU-D7]MCX2949790.1 MerR family transcriptional regulator [Lentzea sp. NEAU-D7]MCX2951082.1 MerR family transcriptional regulator [Lentzea sp. NEAU-D7]